MSRKTFRLPDEVQVSGLPDKLQGALESLGGLGDQFEDGESITDETVHADLYESEDAFLAVVELPGFGKGDIEITVGNGALVVKAERRGSDTGGYRVERTLEIPAATDSGNVLTELESGILRVTLPKTEKP